MPRSPSRPLILSLRQLLFLMTLLGLLPIAVIGAWGIHAAVARQQADLTHSIQRLARALASAVDAELDTTVQTVRTLSTHPALAARDFARFHEAAVAAAAAQPDWRSVILTGADGQVIFKSSRPYGQADSQISDMDSLLKAMSTLRPVVGSVTRGPSGRPAVPIRVPVVADGRTQFVVTVALAPDRLLRILKNQQVPDDWVVSVADAQGLRVARSRDQDNTVATRMSDTLARLMQRGSAEAAGLSISTEGVEMLTTYSTLPAYGWTVAIGAPTAHFALVLRQTLGAYAVAIVVALTLYVALVAFFAKRLVLAIDQLKEQTARLGRRLPARIEPGRVREVNEIGSSLAMASAELEAGEREREALVASLQEALARAERAAATKDNFLAVLGHELRNPLAPIAMALDLMDARAPDACRREREIMRRQVNHMRRLVDDLLDVSRITQGKLTMAHEPVSLAQAVAQALDTVRPAMTGANRRFVEHIEDVWVSGDETRLVQVATNLLVNALRYGGASNVEVSVRRDGANAVFSVADRGVGLAAGAPALIFQPFYQAPQPLARSSGGLGLGLTIVLSIVELMNGTVRASSDGLGQGSRFDVILPAIEARPQMMPAPAPARAAPSAAAPARHDAIPAPAPAPAAPPARRILIVDDNVDAAHTTAEVLSLLGHQVRAVHDGKSALALLPMMQPDVAILDIGLPDIDGFELGRAVRRQGFRGAMLALTGYGQERDREKARDAGFDAHLTKPVDVDALQRAIAADWAALADGEPARAGAVDAAP